MISLLFLACLRCNKTEETFQGSVREQRVNRQPVPTNLPMIRAIFHAKIIENVRDFRRVSGRNAPLIFPALRWKGWKGSSYIHPRRSDIVFFDN
jgi:hypothetical protein